MFQRTCKAFARCGGAAQIAHNFKRLTSQGANRQHQHLFAKDVFSSFLTTVQVGNINNRHHNNAGGVCLGGNVETLGHDRVDISFKTFFIVLCKEISIRALFFMQLTVFFRRKEATTVGTTPRNKSMHIYDPLGCRGVKRPLQPPQRTKSVL